MLAFERVALPEPDAVLARACPSACERIRDEHVDELVRLGQLGRIVGVDVEGDVDVPVPRVPEDPRHEPAPVDLRPRERDRGGELGQRHADVGRARALAGRRSRRRMGRGVPRRPQPGARGRVTLGDDVLGALLRRDRTDELEIGRDRLLRTVGLDEERGHRREVGSFVGVDRGRRPAVDQLCAGHPDAGGDDRDSGARGGGDVGEGDPEHDRVLGDPVQAQRQLGDHGERALGADEEADHVVAGGGLRRCAPGPDHAAVGQHGLEGEHVLAHLAVAHRRCPGRVRRGHAAERGVGAGVDGEEEAVRGRGPAEGAPRHACLDGCGEILRRHPDDPVHPRQVERDAARHRDHVPFEARARAERRDGNAVLVGEGEHRGHLGGALRLDDDVGSVRAVEGDVARVEVELGLAGRDTSRVADRPGQRGAQLLRVHFSRGCQEKRFAATR